MATVRLPASLRRYAGGVERHEVTAGTAGAALRALADRHPDLEERLFDGTGRIRSHLSIVVGDRVAGDPAFPVGDADEVIVTDIYSAGENPIKNVSSSLVVDSIKRHSRSSVQVTQLSDLDSVITRLKSQVRPGDIIITLGAGDVHKVAEALAGDPNILPDAQTYFHVQTG